MVNHKSLHVFYEFLFIIMYNHVHRKKLQNAFYDNERIFHVKSRYEFLVKNQSKHLSRRVDKKKKTYP